jgi:hypothetical protein
MLKCFAFIVLHNFNNVLKEESALSDSEKANERKLIFKINKQYINIGIIYYENQ